MTQQKEYSILFALGAKLNQTFSGSFSKAQQVLKETQNKISELNKTQRDVTSYQKQQESLNKTSERLATYQKQLDNVQKEMAESGKYSSDLANKEEALKLKINETEQAMKAKSQKLQEMAQKLNDAGVDTSNLTEEIKRLNSELENTKKQEEKAAEEADNAKNSGVGAIDAVSSALAAAGITSALSKIADGYKECVAASMEFGYTMSTVEALSGANALEMKELTATAKEYGATTAYTANQSGLAMTFMGMAGWDAGQMIAGMDGMLNLAAASGEDFASVSDIVTDNLTAFKLQAKDTAHFADVLATAASKSNTSVGIMGETFKGSASVAGALGYSIEDIAVGVGLMANSGVKGSIACTALKNTFNGLLSGATLNAAAFGEVEVSTVNADGTMKSFSKTIEDLRGYFEQMTEAERVNNAIAIAGERGYNGLLAILNATDEEYQSLSDSINNCSGAAQRMAEIKLDNLQGDVTLLDSAADGLKMTIGELWNDELRGLAQIGTEILSKINEFIEKNPAVAKSITVVVTALGGFMILSTVINMVKKFGGAITSLLTVNPHMLAMVATVTALTAAWVALREICKQEELESQRLSTATQNQRDEVERLTGEYEEACKKYGETSDQARALKYDLNEATDAIDSQSFSVSELYSEIDALNSKAQDMFSSFAESTAGIEENREKAHTLAAKLMELTSASDKSADSQAKIEPIIKRLNEMYPSLGLTVENVAEKMGTLNGAIDKAADSDSMQARFEKAREQYAEYEAMLPKLQEVSNKAEATLSEAQKRYLNVMGNNDFAGFWQKIGAAVTGTGNAVESELHDASTNADIARNDLRKTQEMIEECTRIMADYGYIVNGTSENAVSAYDAVSIAVNSVTEETQNLLTAYNDAYQAAYESVSGQYALWEQAAEVSVTSADTINSALESQADYWESYNSNLGDLLERSEGIEGLRDVIASFSDGSEDSYNAVAGMVAASDDELKRMVENWQTVQEEQGKVSEALANTKVDFETRLGEITEGMSELIEGMNMEVDAKEAAQDTMEAYAEAILAGKAKAVEAAEQVNEAVNAALAKAMVYDTPKTPEYTEQAITAGSISGRLIINADGDLVRAYASGTDYAERGWAMVGENGPELAYFGGGEQVFTANETKAILGNSRSGNTSGGENITIAPQFYINGNSSDIQDNMQEISEKIVDLIENTLRNKGIDARRGAYV